jgi:CDP-glucose 4,6-dehydratase
MVGVGGFWRDKRLLVTGATGMVGSRLVQQAVAAGAQVVVLVADEDDRSDFYQSGIYREAVIVHGFLEDYRAIEQAVREHEVDTVIHLGAQTIVPVAELEPLATFETNIRGTYNLLEVCRQAAAHVRRIVVASSDKAYGDHGGETYTEDTPFMATHPYDVSKACGDLLARSYAHTYAAPVTIARCSNVYGPGDLNWSRLVPATIRAFLLGERLVLRSDGSPVRDYLFVDDAAAAYLRLAEHASGEGVRGRGFNFSAEDPRSVLAIVKLIADQMGIEDPEPVVLHTDTHEIPRQAVSAQQARTVLGWTPEYALARGLACTIDWYRNLLRAEASRPHTAPALTERN